MSTKAASPGTPATGTGTSAKAPDGAAATPATKTAKKTTKAATKTATKTKVAASSRTRSGAKTGAKGAKSAAKSAVTSTAKSAASAQGAQPAVTSTPDPVVVQPPKPVVSSASLRKKALIEAVTERSGVKRRDAKAAMEASLELLGEAIAEGRRINLPGFGKLKVMRSKKRTNGEIFTIRIRQPLTTGKADGDDGEKPGKDPLAETAE